MRQERYRGKARCIVKVRSLNRSRFISRLNASRGRPLNAHGSDVVVLPLALVPTPFGGLRQATQWSRKKATPIYPTPHFGLKTFRFSIRHICSSPPRRHVPPASFPHVSGPVRNSDFS